MTAIKKQCECPKCGGTGDIPAFSGIANGVCFRCAGTGKIAYRASQRKVAPLTEYAARMIEQIKTADFSTFSFRNLSVARDFAHWPNPHCPELLSIWRERGDEHFFAAQEEMIASR